MPLEEQRAENSAHPIAVGLAGAVEFEESLLAGGQIGLAGGLGKVKGFLGRGDGFGELACFGVGASMCPWRRIVAAGHVLGPFGEA